MPSLNTDAILSEYSDRITLVFLELSTRSRQQARQTGRITSQGMYFIVQLNKAVRFTKSSEHTSNL